MPTLTLTNDFHGTSATVRVPEWENTAKIPPELLLAEAMMSGGSSVFIERQEAQGQRSFVGSDTLPTKIYGERSILEAAGVQFLGPVEGDELFQYVKLPEGWKKEPTDHAELTRKLRDAAPELADALSFYREVSLLLPPRCIPKKLRPKFVEAATVAVDALRKAGRLP